MTNPLDQLYKTKLQLIAVLAVVGGIACLMLAHWSATASVPGWLTVLPLSEIGSTLFGTGLLAVFFEYVDRKHGEERTDQRIREAVRKEAPAIRDAVLDNFAFNVETLKGVASDETLDRIASNALGLRLDDAALAQDVYTDVRNQIIRAPERWRDMNISVELAPWENGPTSGHGSMFVATLRWEYRVTPASSTMRFACVSDPDEYRDLLRDPATASSWYFDHSAPVAASSREAFELVQFMVNGKARTIRRTERQGAQLYSASLGTDAMTGDEVTITYTYRVLVQRHGHLLYVDLPRPTKGLNIRLAYGGVGIRRVNTLDFFASAESAHVAESPSSVPARSVDVSFGGWIFPRSGVAFVWVLDEELADKSSRSTLSKKSAQTKI
ncbi:hypothetical protein [Streptomyces sp. DSM 40484]|uniref:hypothetical protein n=1 Tax=Streptomyces kroppenstedtii TaxID=3051181 RepID=UPI0028D14D8D|nr:hypothetical protein [Streptomyces sp. DSM 40484]